MGARNMLVALVPIHSMEMPPGGTAQWRLDEGGRRDTWEPGFCCPLLSTGSSSPEAGNGQAERRFLWPEALEHLGVML